MAEEENKRMGELFARFDERTHQMMIRMAEFGTIIEDMRRQLNSNYVSQSEFRELKANIEKSNANFVQQGEFRPIKNGVYGIVSLFISGVAGALLTMVIKK